jgi:tRNA modification GTPase
VFQIVVNLRKQKSAMLHTVDLSDTIVALATPPGVGAIGIIRLSGKDAIKIVNEVFPGKDLEQEPSHTIHFGTLRDEGRILDEVLVSLFVAPKSYTGENVVEVSCHGSEYILQKVMELFVKKGARPAEAGEFTMRAFLNGQMDLSQAEAVADLIASSSESSHNIALQQMRGGFSHEIAQLRQELLDFASLIELELDFSEEDVEFANRDALEKLVKKIRTLLKALIDSFQLGNVIKNGVNTVIAGRPNAGKSTLLNAMLKEDRAIVSDIAGTTRDTIEEVFNIQGINYRLIDTAGIRDARDQIEAVGVEKTYEKVKQSAILIYVFDVIETSPEEVKADLEKLATPGLIILGIANKMDLNPYTKAEHYTNDFLSEDHFIPISAKNNMNLGLLKDKLYEAVVSGDLNTESTIVSNTRHYAALQKAYESLDAVLTNMDQGVTSDFIAMDIRQALHHLGTITGEISTDDLLGNIFGKFCIGK